MRLPLLQRWSRVRQTRASDRLAGWKQLRAHVRAGLQIEGILHCHQGNSRIQNEIGPNHLNFSNRTGRPRARSRTISRWSCARRASGPVSLYL